MPSRFLRVENLLHARLAAQGARDRLLRGLVVPVEDLLVVGRFPVDEDAHDHAQVVHLVGRDDAVAHGVDDRARDCRLRRPEHLHRLRGALHRHLVGDDRVRLGRQVGRDHGQQVRVPLLLVEQRSRECLAERPVLPPDQEVDVSDLVALAHQGLTHHKGIRHARLSSLVRRHAAAAPYGPPENRFCRTASYTMARMAVKEGRCRTEDPAVGARRSPEAVAGAAQLACVLEASAEKPGNITPDHDFADASYEDMLRSAIALGPELGRAGERGVGDTVLAAVCATRRVAGANTNLGIALLLAPLARAALLGGTLRERAREVLADLTLDDARAAYAAIRAAGAGGLEEPV